MKRLSIIFSACALALCLSSCWKEVIPQASDRYQVVGLKAEGDDAQVTLSWEAPQQMEPADYRISYLDAESREVVLATEGATNYVVSELENNHSYEFSVQAVYGKGEVSGAVKVSSKPLSRRPSNVKVSDTGNKYLTLVWTAPAYATLQGYTLTYYPTDNKSQAKDMKVSADKLTCTIEDLVNDKEYTVSMVADYPGGLKSGSVEVKGTPTNIIPWTVSKVDVVSGEPVTFRYDQSMLAASEVEWEIPGSGKRSGNEVVASLSAPFNVTSNTPVDVTVVVSAKVGTGVKSWNINMTVRPFLFFKSDWDKGGSSYQGFKNDAPVFSPDGKTIYVMGFANPAILYALDAITGEVKWKYAPATASAGYNGKTVNPVNGDIYFGNSSAGHFYAVRADGTLKWDKTGLGAFNQTSFPALSKDGSVLYLHDASKKLTAVNTADGSTIWQKTMTAKGGGLIVNGDELVVGTCTTTGGVKFLKTSDGSEIASIDLPENMSDGGGFAVSPDRTKAYLGCNLGSVCAIDLVKHSLIASAVTPNDNNTNCNVWELCVNGNGDVFGGNKRGYLFCYDGNTLELKWTETACAGTANAFNYAHPCCDKEGNFYITSGGSRNQNFKISPAGSIIKQWSVLNSDNQKQMSGNAYHNGVFYNALLGGSGENGAMVAVYVGGEDATTGWPCHGGDLCGTCCIK